MKRYRNCLKKVAFLFAIAMFLSKGAFASDFNLKPSITEEYQNWEKLTVEEKAEIMMPSLSETEVPEKILKENKTGKLRNMFMQFLNLGSNSLNVFPSEVYDSRYIIENLRVENQGITNECWAFSLLKGVETNMVKMKAAEELPNFSERHMDYSTSRTFSDGLNEKGFYRETVEGGTLPCGLAYLTNGDGAVLEEDMPFENNYEKIKLSEIDKKVDTVVNDYVILPKIHKTFLTDSTGNTTSVRYTKVAVTSANKDQDIDYTKDEIKAIRNIIKRHIVEYGSISTKTCAGLNSSKFYNNNNVGNATSYNCNDSTKLPDHAITIVGWDDNYSKDNFRNGAKPSTDGAYIVLNSYGEERFDNGYLYISYEDFFIEQDTYGIKSTSKVNYDKLYQHDYYGGLIYLADTSISEGYYAVTYDRNQIESEILNSVGITLSDYVELEIFVNPYDGTFAEDKLVKVATTDLLEPGYHKINIKDTRLKGNEFAIVVKQTSDNNMFSFQIETSFDGTLYRDVKSSGKSFISSDCKTFINLNSLSIPNVNMANADVCIKAFTTNVEEEKEELISEEYRIIDEDIYNIKNNTKKTELLSNFNLSSEIEIYDEENNIVDGNDVIKTGMKLKVYDNTYTLIVRGDVNKDGKLTLTDLSKTIFHYNGNKGYELEGASLKAADMNISGEVTLTDISKIILEYNSI